MWQWDGLSSDLGLRILPKIQSVRERDKSQKGISWPIYPMVHFIYLVHIAVFGAWVGNEWLNFELSTYVPWPTLGVQATWNAHINSLKWEQKLLVFN